MILAVESEAYPDYLWRYSVSKGPRGLGGTESPTPAVYGYKTRNEVPGFLSGPNPKDWLTPVAALSRAWIRTMCARVREKNLLTLRGYGDTFPIALARSLVARQLSAAGGWPNMGRVRQ